MGSISESKARAFVVFGLFGLAVVGLTGATGLQSHDDPGWGGGDHWHHGDGPGDHDRDDDPPPTSTTTTTTSTTTTTTTPAPSPSLTPSPTPSPTPSTTTSSTTITTTTAATTTAAGAPPRITHPTSTPTQEQPLSFTFEVQGSGGGTSGGGTSGGGASGDDLALGEQITVTGSDLPPGSNVKVEIHSAVRLLGWSVVRTDGTFTLTTVLPADLPAGEHTIIVTVYPPAGSPAQESQTLVIGDNGEQEVVLGAFDPGTPPDVGASSHAPAVAVPGPGLNDPTAFGTSLKTAADIHLTGSSVGVIGGIAAAIVLLFAFPAEILRLTLVNNDGRIRRWTAAAVARARRAAPQMTADAARVPTVLRSVARWFRSVGRAGIRRFPVLGSDWVQVLATAGVGAVILAFADPDFGLHGSSARLLLAMFLSILWVVVTVNTVVRLFAARRFDTAARFNTMPFALLFMVVGVIASRLTHLHPGFVIGLVMGVTYARELRHRDEAELALVGGAAFFGVGLISWFAFGALATATGHEEGGFWVELFREVFAAGTLESFVALVVGLLPMTFLEGRPIFEWSRKVWAGVYAVCLITFLVLVVPISGDFRESRGNFFLILAGLIAFAIVAMSIWFAFRMAERRDERREAAATAAAVAARARTTARRR